MSSSPKEVKVVDLTKDGDNKGAKKKSQQARLPFAKIDKNAALAKMETEVKKLSEEAKKRKLSISSTEEEKEVKCIDDISTENEPESKKFTKVKKGPAKKKAKKEEITVESPVVTDNQNAITDSSFKKPSNNVTPSKGSEVKKETSEPEGKSDGSKKVDEAKEPKKVMKVKIGHAKKKAKKEEIAVESPIVTDNQDVDMDSPFKKPSNNVTPIKGSVVKERKSESEEMSDESRKLNEAKESNTPSKNIDKEGMDTKIEPEANSDEIANLKSEKFDDLESFEKNDTKVVHKTPENLNKKRKASDTTPNSGSSSTEKVKKLTPKQLARKAEFDRKRLEKERLKEEARLEKEAAKEAARVKKEAEKEEERLKKEKEKNEKERQKQEKKEEEERIRKEKAEEKERLKKEKEEQKENERRQKEEKEKKKQTEKQAEKDEKERQERAKAEKAEKAKKSFANFFMKKDVKTTNTATPKIIPSNGLNQFRVKDDMKLAPIHRATHIKKNELDQLETKINIGLEKDSLYISILQKSSFKPQSMGKTWPFSAKKIEDEDYCEIVDEDEEDLMGDEIMDEQEEVKQIKVKTVFKKAKLLQFCENQRPAYFGTWDKKSLKIGARKPFTMDSEFFDYDYDSDDDWEEEEQGESLSDEEKDKEEDEKEGDKDKDEEDDDDGFFVGHGVLDKDELKAAEEEFDEEAFDEELEIKKQKLKAQKFEEEYKKKKPNKLKPRVFGCHWNDPNSALEDIAYDQLMKILSPFKAVSLVLTPIIPTSISDPKIDKSNENSPKSAKSGQETSGKPKSLKQVPENALPDLIRLVHANTNNKDFLVREFLEFWTNNDKNLPIPKTKILAKIKEIAAWQKSETLLRKCWLVKDEVLKSYGILEPEIPNKWQYILDQPNKSIVGTPSTPPVGVTPKATPAKIKDSCDTPKSDNPKKPGSTPGSNKSGTTERPPPANLITKFTKVLSEEEKLKRMKDAAEKDKAEAAEKAKAEAARKAKAEAAQKAKIDAAQKAKVEAAEKAKAEAGQKAKVEAAEKSKTETKPVDANPKEKTNAGNQVRRIQPTLIDLTKKS